MKFSDFLRKHLTPKRLALAEWTLSILLLSVLVTNFIGCGGGNGGGSKSVTTPAPSDQSESSSQAKLMSVCPVADLDNFEKPAGSIIEIKREDSPVPFNLSKITVVDHMVMVLFDDTVGQEAMEADHQKLLDRGWKVFAALNATCYVVYTTPNEEKITDAVRFARSLPSIGYASFSEVTIRNNRPMSSDKLKTGFIKTNNRNLTKTTNNGIPGFKNILNNNQWLKNRIYSTGSVEENKTTSFVAVVDDFYFPASIPEGYSGSNISFYPCRLAGKWFGGFWRRAFIE